MTLYLIDRTRPWNNSKSDGIFFGCHWSCRHELFTPARFSLKAHEWCLHRQTNRLIPSSNHQVTHLSLNLGASFLPIRHSQIQKSEEGPVGNWSRFLNMLILFHGFPVDGRLVMNSNFSPFLQKALPLLTNLLCSRCEELRFISPGGSLSNHRLWTYSGEQTWTSCPGASLSVLWQLRHLVSVLILVTPVESVNSTFYKTGNSPELFCQLAFCSQPGLSLVVFSASFILLTN